MLNKRSEDLGSFERLNANNLEAVGTGIVMKYHIPEAGSHSRRNGQVMVFAEHLGTKPKIK